MFKDGENQNVKLYLVKRIEISESLKNMMIIILEITIEMKMKVAAATAPTPVDHFNIINNE